MGSGFGGSVGVSGSSGVRLAHSTFAGSASAGAAVAVVSMAGCRICSSGTPLELMYNGHRLDEQVKVRGGLGQLLGVAQHWRPSSNCGPSSVCAAAVLRGPK